MKKVLLVNGSPHKNVNTAAVLKIMEKELQERGLETVWFQLDGKPFWKILKKLKENQDRLRTENAGSKASDRKRKQDIEH